jgi:hypothetical protein
MEAKGLQGFWANLILGEKENGDFADESVANIVFRAMNMITPKV